MRMDNHRVENNESSRHGVTKELSLSKYIIYLK